MEMSRTKRTSIRAGLAAAMAVGVVATGIGGALAATDTTPTIHVGMTDKAMYVDGPLSIPAGRLRLTVENAKAKHSASVNVVKLAPGYAWKSFRGDLKVAFGNLFAPNGNKKKGLKALNHALDNITAYGGLDNEDPGKTERGTLLLTQPGTYALFDDSGSLPRDPRQLTVTAPVGPQTLTADKKVVAMTNRRFGGAKVLPAHGTISFTNQSTESPHFLGLQHVKNGTTRKQVIDAFSGNGSPNIFLQGDENTDVTSYGQTMNLKLHLPKGTYALACFFPDPKTGMPHALMGMVRIVHLK
jgi:hypothetical protein